MKKIDTSLKIGAKKFHQKRIFAQKLSEKYRKKYFKGNNIKKQFLEKRKNVLFAIQRIKISYLLKEAELTKNVKSVKLFI